MIKRILNHKLLVKKPPVIIDLGAAGESYDIWSKLYKYSIFLALDGEERKSIKNKYNFKKYFLVNRIIDSKKGIRNFYQTKSSFCSSVLKPSDNKTRKWFFYNQFKIVKKRKIHATTLNEILKKRNINNIDILKIDLQGIDLAVFKSIPKKIRKNIQFVDIEPSLYGFYDGETNNVSETLKFMQKDFFIEDISFGKHIKGNIANIDNLNNLKKKLIHFNNKKSISYLNISFLRKFSKKDYNDRNLLIYICLLILKKRYTEIFDILKEKKSDDIIFSEIKTFCENKINNSLIKYILFLPINLYKKIINNFK